MNKRVIVALCVIIFLSSQTDKTVIVKIYCHWTYDWRYHNIYPEVIFVTLIESRPFYILLNDVLVLWFFYLSSEYFFPFGLIIQIAVLGKYINTLLYFEVILHIFSIFFISLIELNSHFLNFLMDKNSSTLTARFWLTNEKSDWLTFRLSFCHLSVFYFLFSTLSFLFRVSLNIMKFSWVHPCLRKELVVIWKFFLEPFQMHTQSTFTTNVVHA